MTHAGVVGLDLSLRGTAAAYLPPDWVPGDWSTVRTMTVGYEGGDEEKNNMRLADISDAVCGFVEDSRARNVGIESYAFKAQGNRLLQVAELVGAVRAKLMAKLGASAVTVQQATLRKFFLGTKLPRGKGAVPMAVHKALKELGCPWEGSDEGDAVLVANYLRTELGMPGLTLATG